MAKAITVKLNKSANYQEVFAVNDKHYGLSAKTYQNVTQASRYAEKVGGKVWTAPGTMSPFYVIPGDE